jgi:hypothetical protein
VPSHHRVAKNDRTARLTVRAGLRDGGEGGGGGKGGVGKFLTGFLVGGVVCGVAGVLFAPQLSKTLLKGKDSVGKFLYEDWTEVGLCRPGLDPRLLLLFGCPPGGGIGRPASAKCSRGVLKPPLTS